jgi:U4/U6 small nuclear ribonucleoprotein PRP3
LIVDARGRAVDAAGNVVSEGVKPVTTLKINEPTRVAPAAGVVEPPPPPAEARKPATAASTAAASSSGRMNPYLMHRVLAPEGADAAGGAMGAAGGAGRGRGSGRGRGALHFAEPGEFTRRAEVLREKMARESAQAAFRERGSRMRPAFHGAGEAGVASAAGAGSEAAGALPASAAAGGSSAPAASSATVSAAAAPPAAAAVPPKQRDPAPDMEWWDAAFLPAAQQKAYVATHVGGVRTSAAIAAAAAASAAGSVDGAPVFSYDALNVAHAKSWQYIHHPVPILPSAEPAQPVALPLMLTKQERKKLRRQRRAEREREKTDMVRLGLLPAPEPKVRLSNLMRVLKDSAVADPSAVEAKVRAEMAARRRNHEMRGVAKKLTPEERREKWRRKMTEPEGSGPQMALFRVADLSDRQNRYKVDVNARQFFITGVVLNCKPAGVALVLAEGGPRAIRRYVRLMMERINWNKKEDEDEDDSEDEEGGDDGAGGAGTGYGDGSGVVGAKGAGPGGKCELVWRGTGPRRFYSDFRFDEAATLATARRLMEVKGLAHMWDMVQHSGERAAGRGGAGGAAGGEDGGRTFQALGASLLAGGFVAAKTIAGGAAGGAADAGDSSSSDSSDSEREADGDARMAGTAKH